MPTCVDLADAKYPGNVPPMEGRSLLPAFAGKPIVPEALYWEHEGNRAIRTGKWKAVALLPDGEWELYDMERDRMEMHNLASVQPQRVRAMAEQWEQWARRTHALPWPWQPAYSSKAER